MSNLRLSSLPSGLRLVFGLVLLLALLLGLRSLPSWRIDATREKLFTISAGVKTMLSRLPQPVEATLYYSPQLGTMAPVYGLYASRVEDMLREFAAASGGKFTYRKIDPIAFSPAEDEALAAGLKGIQDNENGGSLYFGFVAKSVVSEANQAKTDTAASDTEMPVKPTTQGLITFFQPEREAYLEYDLIRLISSLNQNHRPKLAVVTGSSMFYSVMAAMRGMPSPPWEIIHQLQDQFDVVQVNNAEDLVKAQPDLLWLVNPAALAKDMQYAIDQYSLKGGKIIALVDPWFETAQESQAMGQSLGMAGMGGMEPAASEASSLLKQWGLSMNSQIVADLDHGVMVNGGGEGSEDPIPYAIWPNYHAENLLANYPALANVNDLLFPAAGGLTINPDAPKELRYTTLINTGANIAAVDKDKAVAANPQQVLQGATKLNGPLALAIMIQGKGLVTNFPDGPPPPAPEAKAKPDAKGEEPKGNSAADTSKPDVNPQTAKPPLFKAEDQIKISQNETSILVISDADFIADRFWVRKQNFLGQSMTSPINDNGAFMQNMIEMMVGEPTLAALRGRGVGQSPFTKLDEVRAYAEQQYRARAEDLSAKVTQIQSRLNLQSKIKTKDSLNQDGAKPTEEQSSEMDEATRKSLMNELLIARQDLRSVTLRLQESLKRIEIVSQFLLTFAFPSLVGVLALYLTYKRRRRRQ